MNEAERHATEMGQTRGWEHAAYVEAYGGTMKPEESEISIPYYAEGVETFYTAGYFEGIEQYISEQMDSAFPDYREDDEYEDPREPEWQGLV